MQRSHKKYLFCPRCKGNLSLRIFRLHEDRIQEGMLYCDFCNKKYPIINYIPRFVSSEGYTESFSYQWKKMGHLQYDSVSGKPISKERFFAATGWDTNMKDQVVLETGCGAGRFTEVAIQTGAFVIAMDYSNAVEINYALNRRHENLLVIQADIYQMPFPKNYFDKVFSLGVLQHLPNPEKGFFSLVEVLKPKGDLVIDVYRKSLFHKWLSTKYYLRPFTKRMDKEKLLCWIEKWVDFWWDKLRWISLHVPYGRYMVKNFFFISDYRGELPLEDKMLRQWAILDTFDRLSPEYDSPQSLKTVKRWFEKGDFEKIEVFYGGNGIIGRGRKREKK